MRTFNLIRRTLIIIFTVTVLYPLVYTIMLSFKSQRDVLANPLWINSFQPENYVNAWIKGHASEFFLNSVYITGISVILCMFVILLAAYSVAFLKPPGYKIIFTIIISMLFISSEMTTIPNFLTIKNLGLYNTREGLILIYVATSFAMGTYIMAGAFDSVPKELEDSAMIDGAGIFKTMTNIFLPLVLPSIACVAVLLFQAVWSEFFWALVLIQDVTKKTLMLGLMSFQSQFTTDYGVLTAGLVIATLPILTVFVFGSKYFISGVASGAVKG